MINRFTKQSLSKRNSVKFVLKKVPKSSTKVPKSSTTVLQKFQKVLKKSTLLKNRDKSNIDPINLLNLVSSVCASQIMMWFENIEHLIGHRFELTISNSQPVDSIVKRNRCQMLLE